MLHALRFMTIVTAAWACVSFGPALGQPDAPEPRQSRPQQLAQSCRTICILELNACERTCDSAAVRVDCIAQCQTRYSVCTSTCR